MTLEPQAAKLMAMMLARDLPSFEQVGYEIAREGFENQPRAGIDTEVASVTDETVPGPDGNNVTVRIYTPTAPARSTADPNNKPSTDDNNNKPHPTDPNNKPHPTGRPGLVYFHGGGWVVGSIETHDQTCRMLTEFSGAVTVSVDYRLAPEHRFPAGLEDCYAATAWVHDNAERLGIDPDALVVGGDSAGGNLAAVVAQICRDRGGPSVAMQLLIYPVTDFDRDTASMLANAEGYLLTRETMRWFDDLYLPEGDGRSTAAADPYAAPLRSDNLSDLPPAVVIVAGHDPLRDEGAHYANRLGNAGVPTTLLEYPGQFHGFFSMTKFLEQATQANHLVGEMIRNITHQTN